MCLPAGYLPLPEGGHFPMPTPIETILAARDLLRDLTPLKSNCGKLCGGAC